MGRLPVANVSGACFAGSDASGMMNGARSGLLRADSLLRLPEEARTLSSVEADLPMTVREFIARNIVSIEQLEVLLLLQEHSGRDWSAIEVNERLRSQEASIAKWLSGLVALKLVVTTNGRFHFTPTNEQTQREVTALAQAYRERRLKVIEQIFSKPNGALRSFVNAFDLRKRP